MGCGASRKVVPAPPAPNPATREGQSRGGPGGAGPRPEAAAEAARRMQVARFRAKFDPRVLARYDIKALIGTGNFSKVVRVEQKTTKKPFAIKVMETRVREGREACESELTVLKRVSHCYIVRLMEIFEAQDRVYMVMELATGGELFDRLITQGSFTEQDAVRILRMVADGIRYLHALRITHRDLKPENLLFYHPGAESKILITDFSLAHSGNKSGDWTMRTLCGTPEYIAPEVWLRKPYTSAVDMWALGVITYLLLSGVLPFDDENLSMQTLSQQSRRRYTQKLSMVLGCLPWPNISHLAKDFIDQLLISEASHRMSAGQALDHPWVVTRAGGSSVKNLQKVITRNLLWGASPHSQSPGSAHSAKSRSYHKSRHTCKMVPK
ncbi:hypothetical protein MC885_012949, partial [Smutsia gigantea]